MTVPERNNTMNPAPQTLGNRVRSTTFGVFLGLTGVIWIGLWIVLMIVAKRAPKFATYDVWIVIGSVTMILIGSLMLVGAVRLLRGRRRPSDA